MSIPRPHAAVGAGSCHAGGLAAAMRYPALTPSALFHHDPKIIRIAPKVD